MLPILGFFLSFSCFKIGVTEKEFHSSILGYLREKLGYHQGLEKVADDLLDFTDADKDNRVNLFHHT